MKLTSEERRFIQRKLSQVRSDMKNKNIEDVHEFLAAIEARHARVKTMRRRLMYAGLATGVLLMLVLGGARGGVLPKIPLDRVWPTAITPSPSPAPSSAATAPENEASHAVAESVVESVAKNKKNNNMSSGQLTAAIARGLEAVSQKVSQSPAAQQIYRYYSELPGQVVSLLSSK